MILLLAFSCREPLLRPLGLAASGAFGTSNPSAPECGWTGTATVFDDVAHEEAVAIGSFGGARALSMTGDSRHPTTLWLDEDHEVTSVDDLAGDGVSTLRPVTQLADGSTLHAGTVVGELILPGLETLDVQTSVVLLRVAPDGVPVWLRRFESDAFSWLEGAVPQDDGLTVAVHESRDDGLTVGWLWTVDADGTTTRRTEVVRDSSLVLGPLVRESNGSWLLQTRTTQSVDVARVSVDGEVLPSIRLSSSPVDSLVPLPDGGIAVSGTRYSDLELGRERVPFELGEGRAWVATFDADGALRHARMDLDRRFVFSYGLQQRDGALHWLTWLRRSPGREESGAWVDALPLDSMVLHRLDEDLVPVCGDVLLRGPTSENLFDEVRVTVAGMAQVHSDAWSVLGTSTGTVSLLPDHQSPLVHTFDGSGVFEVVLGVE